MNKVVKISGIIISLDGKTDVDHDEMIDKLYEYLESQGLCFGGITEPKRMTKNGELINCE